MSSPCRCCQWIKCVSILTWIRMRHKGQSGPAEHLLRLCPPCACHAQYLCPLSFSYNAAVASSSAAAEEQHQQPRIRCNRIIGRWQFIYDPILRSLKIKQLRLECHDSRINCIHCGSLFQGKATTVTLLQDSVGGFNINHSFLVYKQSLSHSRSLSN